MITTDDLIRRLEEKAIELDKLQRENEWLRNELAALPERLETQWALAMSRTSVNCGASSSCAVARWWLERIEQRKKAKEEQARCTSSGSTQEKAAE